MDHQICLEKNCEHSRLFSLDEHFKHANHQFISFEKYAERIEERKNEIQEQIQTRLKELTNSLATQELQLTQLKNEEEHLQVVRELLTALNNKDIEKSSLHSAKLLDLEQMLNQINGDFIKAQEQHLLNNIKDQKRTKESQQIRQLLFFYSLTDLDKWSNLILLSIIRLTMAVYCTKNFIYPDEYWQGTEVAYHLVYGGVSLTWEWQPGNEIRSFIYPTYLSLPLRVLKYFQLDDHRNVRASYYIAQALLVIQGDYYFYKLGCRVMGKTGARVSMYFYFAMKYYNIYVLKTFSNSVESVLSVIIFYHFWGIKKNFDLNLVFAVVFIIIQMFIRCTSVVVWVPLFLFKIILNPRLLNNCILAAVYIAIPVTAICIAIDSYGYGVISVTPYNFIKKNLYEDISSNFGVSEKDYYIKETIPYAFNLALIPLALQILIEFKNLIFRGEVPYLFIYPMTLIGVLSQVPHKEDRFIQSAIPFLVLLIGKFYYRILLTRLRWVIALIFGITILSEVVLQGAYYRFDQKRHQSMEAIMDSDPNPQQIYHAQRLEVPYHSMSHLRNGKVDLFFPRFQGGNYGGNLWNPQDSSHYYCRDIDESIRVGWWPPKYVILQHFDCMNGFCVEDCQALLANRNYRLLNKFECEAGEYKQLLRVEFQPIYVFKKEE